MFRVLGFDGYRDREMSRHVAERGIEADVINGAWHRLQSNDQRAAALEPRCAFAHDRLSESARLQRRSDGKGAHPALRTREVAHVECYYLITLAAPQHRATVGILDREAPDRRAQIRNMNANEAVLAIPVGKCAAEHRVKA